MAVISDNFDAIVVGARVAGCATAAGLAKRGWRVALVERKAGALGMTLSVPICYPRALRQFALHGFQPVLDAIAPRLAQLRTFHLRLSPDLLIQGKPPAYGGFDYSSILRREVLDDALLTHVRATYPSITYFPGYRVDRLLTDAHGQVEGVEAIAERDGNTSHQLRARLTIGADGRQSTVARLLGVRNQRERPGVITIVYSYCTGLDWSGLPDVVFTPATQHRMVVTTNVGEGLTVAGVFLPVTQYEQFSNVPDGQTRHDRLTETLRTAPELADRLDHLEWQGAAMRFRPDQNIGYFRAAGGAGWALVGDATHFKDPASGQGLHDALVTVGYLMQTLDDFTDGMPLTQTSAGSAAWLRALRAMQRKRDRAFTPMFNYTYTFAEALTRDPTWIERRLFRAIAADPKLTERFLGISTGATDVRKFNRAAPFYLLRRPSPSAPASARITPQQ